MEVPHPGSIAARCRPTDRKDPAVLERAVDASARRGEKGFRRWRPGNERRRERRGVATRFGLPGTKTSGPRGGLGPDTALESALRSRTTPTRRRSRRVTLSIPAAPDPLYPPTQTARSPKSGRETSPRTPQRAFRKKSTGARATPTPYPEALPTQNERSGAAGGVLGAGIEAHCDRQFSGPNRLLRHKPARGLPDVIRQC